MAQAVGGLGVRGSVARKLALLALALAPLVRYVALQQFSKVLTLLL